MNVQDSLSFYYIEVVMAKAVLDIFFKYEVYQVTTNHSVDQLSVFLLRASAECEVKYQ